MESPPSHPLLFCVRFWRLYNNTEKPETHPVPASPDLQTLTPESTPINVLLLEEGLEDRAGWAKALST